MRDFMTRGGAISVDHLSELHRAADDLAGPTAEPVGGGRAVQTHAGSGEAQNAASGAARGFFALLTPEQKAAALAYDGPQDFGSDELRIGEAEDEGPHAEVHWDPIAASQSGLFQTPRRDGGWLLCQDRGGGVGILVDQRRDPFPGIRMRGGDVPSQFSGLIDAPQAFADAWRVFDAAVSYAAAAGPLPLASSEPWVEGDWPYWKRLVRGRPTAECEALWGRWSWGDEELDDIGASLGLPRARLVPATLRAEGEVRP